VQNAIGDPPAAASGFAVRLEMGAHNAPP
jgi:hypothetical protein